jgi:hypothetical protein
MTKSGNDEMAAQVVRYITSGFGEGIPSQGLACLNEKKFSQFRIPKQGTELGDSPSTLTQALAQGDLIQLTQVEPLSRNRFKVTFRIQLAGGKTLPPETVVFMRHTSSRAQEQLGCVSFLERPQVRYRPVPGYCPGVPSFSPPPPHRVK